jgi:hypothetical protein
MPSKRKAITASRTSVELVELRSVSGADVLELLVRANCNDVDPVTIRVDTRGVTLDIHQSGLENAGNGLFIASGSSGLQRGDVVGLYTGRIVAGQKEELMLTPHEMSYTRRCISSSGNLKIFQLLRTFLQDAGFIVFSTDSMCVCGFVPSGKEALEHASKVFPLASANESVTPNMITEGLCELVVDDRIVAGQELTTSYGPDFKCPVPYTIEVGQVAVNQHYASKDVDVVRSAFHQVVVDSVFLDNWLKAQANVCVEASLPFLAANWFAHVKHDDCDMVGFFDSALLMKYLGPDNVASFPWIQHVAQWKRGSGDVATISATEATVRLFAEVNSNNAEGKKDAAIFALIREVALIVGHSVVALHPVFHYACEVAVEKLEFDVDDCFKWASSTMLLLMTCQHGFEEAQPIASSVGIRNPAAYEEAIVGYLYNSKLSSVTKSMIQLSKHVKTAFAVMKTTIGNACTAANETKTAGCDASAFCAIFAAWLTLRLTMVEYEGVEVGAYLPWDKVVSDDASWYEKELLVHRQYDQLELACKNSWRTVMGSSSGKKLKDAAGYPKVCPTLLGCMQWDLSRVHSFYSSILWDSNALSNVGLCVDTAIKVCLVYDSSGSTADSIEATTCVNNLIRLVREKVRRSFVTSSTERKVMAAQVPVVSIAGAVSMPLDHQWAMRKFKVALGGMVALLGEVVNDDVADAAAESEALDSSQAGSNPVACKWPKHDAVSVWKSNMPKTGTWIMSASCLPEVIGVLAEKVGAHRRKRAKDRLEPLVVMKMEAMQFHAAQARVQQGGFDIEKTVLGAEHVLELLAATGATRVAWVVQDLVMRGHKDPLNPEVQNHYLRQSAYYMRRLHTQHGQKIIAAKDVAVAKGKSAPWALGTDLKQIEEKAKKASAKEFARVASIEKMARKAAKKEAAKNAQMLLFVSAPPAEVYICTIQ